MAFDPKKYIQETTGGAEPDQSEFDPKQYIQATSPVGESAPSAGFDPKAYMVSTGISPDMPEKSVGDYISDSEVTAIATRHGVPEEFVRNWALYSGTSLETRADTPTLELIERAAKQTAGSLGNMLGGLPQFGAKKALYEEGSPERAAIDEIRGLASERASGSRMVSEIAGGIALPAGPAGRISTAIGKLGAESTAAVRLAQQSVANAGLSGSLGALYGLGGSVEGAESGAAVSGALWGILLSPALPQAGGSAIARARTAKAARETEQAIVRPDLARDLMEEATAYVDSRDYTSLLDNLDELGRAPFQEQRDVLDFARFIAPSKRLDDIEDATGLLREKLADREYLESQLRNFRIAQRMQENLAEQVDIRRGVTAESLDASSGINNFLRDARYVASEIDRKNGTPIERELDILSNMHNASTQVQSKLYDDLDELGKLTRRSGRASEEIISEIEGSDPSKPLSEVAERWRGIFSTWRERINEINRGLSGDKAAEMVPLYAGGKRNYIPRYAVDEDQFILRMEKRRGEIEKAMGRELNSMDPRTLEDWIDATRRAGTNSPENEYLRALDIMLPEGHQVETAEQLAAAIFQSENYRKVGRSLRLNAPSLQRREDALPEFLRETDLAKLLDKWGRTMTKEVYYRRGIDRLRAYEKALRESGRTSAANYIGNLATDLVVGPNRGFAGVTRDMMTGMRVWGNRKAEKATNPITKAYYSSVGELGNLITIGSANMYPFFLGLRPDAVLRNMTQPFLVTAPEIAAVGNRKYGYSLALKAQLDTMADILSGKGEIAKHLRDTGRLPAEFRGEMTEAIQQGMLEDPGLRKVALRWGKKKLDQLGQAAMYFYSASDTYNRAVTYSMAKRMASDITKGGRGGESALAAIRQMPRSYQRELGQALAAGNESALRETLADYLLSKTQFNYNRAAMSDYGRYMGGMFSMFSKWPTSMYGDAVDMITGNVPRDDRLARIGIKYLGPLASAMALETFLLEDAREENPWVRKLAGGNIATATPASSLEPFITGEFGQPPILSVPGSIYSAATSADWDKLPEKAANGIASITPGGVIWKFYTDWYPLLFGEDE